MRTRTRFIRIVCGATALASMACSPALSQNQTYTLTGDRAWEESASGERNASAVDHPVLYDARRLLATGGTAEARAALRMLDSWAKANGGTVPLEHAPEFSLLRGDALVVLDREYKALFEYERVAENYPASEQFSYAVERSYNVGVEYMRGMRRTFLGMRVLDAQDLGVELIIRAQERLPGSVLAERANLSLADYFYSTRDMELAADTYEVYLLNYPEGSERAEAAKRLIFADLARFKGPRYDASGLLDARLRIQEYERMYPAQAQAANIDQGLVIRIDESLAAQLLEHAEWYLKRDNEPSARYVVGRLLVEYPNSIAAQAGLGIAAERGWDDGLTMGSAGRADGAGTADGVRVEGELEGQVEAIVPSGNEVGNGRSDGRQEGGE